ncbi:DUF7547 family protein [Halocatena pleomorpha]|uniref:Uncharacterized protein n=1 Tax=Halocatena pleomorpha TaxID=1785090 RepID=A0A3P3RKA1_9EURY|nr:hypothetical protein [Halocatena pleomorpha]RRJ33754.1 hypothetical protein EIK79_02895 [Halocatena pleomorpha]
MAKQDEDLEELLTELSTTLSELQDTLADEHQPRSRRLPSPGRFLRFTEEHTIPTLISLLETHIRALELLQGVLGLVNGQEQQGTSRQRENRRVQETGRRTLDALDGALSDLQGALHGEPSNDDARALLNDARTLREEIDDRLTNSTETSETNGTEDTTDEQPIEDGAIRIDVSEPDTDPSDDGIDVDEELDTIKRELDDDEDDNTD